MARINFEDDVEAQEEFWNLLPLCGGDRDKALGRLIRFFRLAQKAYGHQRPTSEDEIRKAGFTDMVESGWAVPVEGGYQALGAEKHFGWYRQRVEAGEKRASAERDSNGRFVQRPTSEEPAVDQRKENSHQPLSLSLSLSQIQNTAQRKRRADWKSEFDLEAAYKLYPRKQGKSKGMKRLASDVKSPEDYQALLKAIAHYQNSDDCLRGFVKHFSTFASEWRDWIDPEAGQRPFHSTINTTPINLEDFS